MKIGSPPPSGIDSTLRGKATVNAGGIDDGEPTWGWL